MQQTFGTRKALMMKHSKLPLMGVTTPGLTSGTMVL